MADIAILPMDRSGQVIAPGSGAAPDAPGYARASLLLAEYGLTGMDDWLRSELVDGASDDTIALDLERTPQYKARFFAREQAKQWNQAHPNDQHHVPTPAEILEYENSARTMMKMANMPPGFYDSNEDLQGLMANGKSLQELQADINEGFVKVSQAPAEVRQAYAEMFGADGDYALASHFLDPKMSLPVLEHQVKMADIAGAGIRWGTRIRTDQASRLADLGVDTAAADAGFERVNQMSSLYGATVGEQSDPTLTAQDTGVNFGFNLDAGASKAKLVSREERRAADFGGVGAAARDNSGLAGLGTAV